MSLTVVQTKVIDRQRGDTVQPRQQLAERVRHYEIRRGPCHTTCAFAGRRPASRAVRAQLLDSLVTQRSEVMISRSRLGVRSVSSAVR